MTLLAWPLERNSIRRDIKNNAFGMVRNGGTRAHQGWDLRAMSGTPCYAIADGRIAYAQPRGALGNMILLEFTHQGRILYAAYCHLSIILSKEKDQVRQGEVIGYTGNTGNAQSMQGVDQHLHFEIRTGKFPGEGLGGRVDPATLYGRVPMGWTYFEYHNQKTSAAGLGIKAQGVTGLGLKVRGVNVREGFK